MGARFNRNCWVRRHNDLYYQLRSTYSAASAGGTPPYYYVWTEGALGGSVIATSTSTSVDPAVSTYFYVTSTDENGCVGDTSEVLVTVREELDAEIPRPDTICPYDVHGITAYGSGW